jgi:SAM-dependent methyltransferase
MKKLNVNELPEKGEDPNTTSRKFKQDLYDFFKPLKLETCLEVSSCYGNMTYVLSHIFENVIYVEAPSFENSPNHFYDISENARKNILGTQKNIIYSAIDAYKTPWPFRYVDVVVIDCAHYYNEVISDIKNAMNCIGVDKGRHGYIVFDDWNLPEGDFGVQRAIKASNLEIVQFIGRKVEFNPKNLFDFKFDTGDYEGLICKV